jgi:hypothetical protein
MHPNSQSTTLLFAASWLPYAIAIKSKCYCYRRVSIIKYSLLLLQAKKATSTPNWKLVASWRIKYVRVQLLFTISRDETAESLAA